MNSSGDHEAPHSVQFVLLLTNFFLLPGGSLLLLLLLLISNAIFSALDLVVWLHNCADCLLLSNSDRWGRWWWWWWSFLLIINHNATRCSLLLCGTEFNCTLAGCFSLVIVALVVADKRIALWDVCCCRAIMPSQASPATEPPRFFPAERGRNSQGKSIVNYYSRESMRSQEEEEEMVSYRQRNRNTCTAPSSYYDGHQMDSGGCCITIANINISFFHWMRSWKGKNNGDERMTISGV